MENLKESVFIRIDVGIELPKQTGNYLTTLEFPNGTKVVKKVFFTTKFELKNGKKEAKVINWFKRIEINKDLYEKIIKENVY